VKTTVQIVKGPRKRTWIDIKIRDDDVAQALRSAMCKVDRLRVPTHEECFGLMRVPAVDAYCRYILAAARDSGDADALRRFADAFGASAREVLAATTEFHEYRCTRQYCWRRERLPGSRHARADVWVCRTCRRAEQIAKSRKKKVA